MQHAGQRGIVNEAGMRENLVGDIEPLNGISGKHALRRSFGHGTRRRLAIQRDIFGELPVAGPDIAGAGDDAIVDVERVDSDAQPIGGEFKKDLPDFGADLPDGAARLLHRKTARGDALVGAARRRRADHLHAADIDIEFVGGDLGQRRHDALPDLDLSRRDRHVSLRRKPDP